MPDELMAIGTFSIVTGLSISTLRHYDDIGRVLGGDEDDAREVLARQRAVLRERAERVDVLLEQLTQDRSARMKSAAGFRLVAVNVGVDSEDALEVACAFWGEVLGTQLEDWGGGSRQVVLGAGDAMGFLNIRVRSGDEPQYGHRSAFGLGVVGLDEAHRRALAAGATEQYPPTDGENMPRHSRIADPVGNRVVLWESA